MRALLNLKQYKLWIAGVLLALSVALPAHAQLLDRVPAMPAQLGPVLPPAPSLTEDLLRGSATGNILGITSGGAGNSRTLCSDDASFAIKQPTAAEGGIVTNIVKNIQQKLSTVSQQLFQSIASNQGFVVAIQGALTLFIAVYGLMFMAGMVELKLYDFIIRMVKFGIIIYLLKPEAWQFFSTTIVYFFNAGVDDLINKVTSVAVGGTYVPDGGPFLALDGALSKAASGKMAVTLLAMFTTGPYGMLFGLLLILSLGSFLKSLLTALWVYVMALAMRTLLFGLAPIFIPCILFNRTRPLFDGWISQIVNASLQPVLLFIFFVFFVKLIEASIANIIAVPVCFTEFPQGWRGSEFAFYYWRFATKNSSGHYEPYTGEWNIFGAQTPGSPVFPIDLMTILTFFILAELASRFNTVIVNIASELAGASANFSSMQGAFSNILGGGGAAGGGGINKVLNSGVSQATKDSAARAAGTTGTRS